MKKINFKKGYVTLMAILFMAVLLLVSVGLGGFAISYNRLQRAELRRAESFAIAEAGLDWVKWYLTHYPNDMDLDSTNGSSDDYPGTITVDYKDETGTVVGKYEVELTPNAPCGTVTSVDVYVKGWVLGDEGNYRKVRARLARPSVAEYSYIYNSYVWAGDDRTIYGPYHSNDQVRMDGTNLSTVSSHLTSKNSHDGVYTSPSNNPKPNKDLWQFPVDEIDFGRITVDMNVMKTLAQDATHGGNHYYGNTGSGKYGYVVELKGGVYDVKRVNSVVSLTARNNRDGTHHNYLPTGTLTSIATDKKIPAGCSVLFFDDDVWIKGTLDTKVTIGVKDPNPSRNAQVTVIDDIVYSTQSGEAGLVLVSEGDVEIGLTADSANDDSNGNGHADLWLNGVFIAQKGRFGRDHYRTSDLPSAYDPYVKREFNSHDQTSLIINGSVISNQRGGTQWVNGSGTYISGYEKRENYYNVFTSLNPPVLTPSTSQEYSYISWREVYK